MYVISLEILGDVRGVEGMKQRTSHVRVVDVWRVRAVENSWGTTRLAKLPRRQAVSLGLFSIRSINVYKMDSYQGNVDLFRYRIGKHVYPDSFDYTERQCSNGIHFFDTAEQAMLYDNF